METDQTAFVHFGGQSWHPVAIGVEVDRDFALRTGERATAIVITPTPRTGNLNHWLALSPGDARRLAAQINAALEGAG